MSAIDDKLAEIDSAKSRLAHGCVAWLQLDSYAQGIRFCLEQASPARGAEVTVTDEMVERALEAFMGKQYEAFIMFGGPAVEEAAKDMRAALLAALTISPTGLAFGNSTSGPTPTIAGNP